MGVEGKVRAERDLVRALELTEELVQLKLALGDKIREGTFQFSRQRYARGPHAVSELQYNLNSMRATTKIRATPRSIDDFGHVRRTPLAIDDRIARERV